MVPKAVRTATRQMAPLSRRVLPSVASSTRYRHVIGASIVVVRAHLAATGVPTECWAEWFGSGGQPSTACEIAAQAFLEINEYEAGKVMAAMAVLPVAVGLVLGVPLVARELEQRTAVTAWSLSGSRARWFLGRFLPIGTLAFVAIAIVAELATGLVWMRQPWLAEGVGFSDLGLHGPISLSRGIAALALGIVVGAVLGRTLPAILVSTVLAVVLVAFVVPLARGLWMETRAVELTSSPGMAGDLPDGAMGIRQLLRTEDGRLISWDEVDRLFPGGIGADAFYETLTPVDFVVPGSLRPEAEALETLAWLMLTGGLVLLVVPVIERRRPT